MKKKHTQMGCLQALKKKHDVKIEGNVILVLSDNSPYKMFDLGNKSWGRIDYLVKVQEYNLIFVEQF